MNPYEPPEHAGTNEHAVAESVSEPESKLAEAIKVFLAMTVFVIVFVGALSLITSLLTLTR